MTSSTTSGDFPIPSTSATPPPELTPVVAEAPVVTAIVTPAVPSWKTILGDMESLPQFQVKPIQIPLKEALKSTKWAKFLPSIVTETLERKSRYYIVLANGKFHYYRIAAPVAVAFRTNLPGTPQVAVPTLYAFTKLPIICAEGLVVIDKEIYFVTVDDLRRGYIRTSRLLKLQRYQVTYESIVSGRAFIRKSPPATKAAKSGTAEEGSGAMGPGNIFGDADRVPDDPDKPGIGFDASAAEIAAANRAFRDQVGTLYGIQDSEEEGWEIQNNSQS